MTKFAKVDANGALLGFYDSVLMTPPAGAVQLTDAQYAQWVAAQFSLVWSASASSLVAAPPAAPAPVPVPTTVTSFQLKAALLAMPGSETGKTLLDDVNAWVATGSSLLYLAWTESPTVTRNGTFVSQASAKFGWTSAQLDAIFTAAAAIQA